MVRYQLYYIRLCSDIRVNRYEVVQLRVWSDMRVIMYEDNQILRVIRYEYGRT